MTFGIGYAVAKLYHPPTESTEDYYTVFPSFFFEIYAFWVFVFVCINVYLQEKHNLHELFSSLLNIFWIYLIISFCLKNTDTFPYEAIFRAIVVCFSLPIRIILRLLFNKLSA